MGRVQRVKGTSRIYEYFVIFSSFSFWNKLLFSVADKDGHRRRAAEEDDTRAAGTGSAGHQTAGSPRQRTGTHCRTSYCNSSTVVYPYCLQELSEKCSVKCVSSPGSSLSSGEKQCLQRCLDRFMESWNLISTTLQVLSNT